MRFPDEDPAAHIFADLLGRRVAGGCADCDAYQVIRREEIGFYRCTVHHDDDCPVLARHQAVMR